MISTRVASRSTTQLEHLPDHVAGALPRLDRQRPDQLAHVIRAKAEQRIDVDASERFRLRPSELLDLDAALGGHHRQVVPARAVQQERGVELARDRQELLDEDARDGESLEIGADHPVGGRGGGLGRLAELDAAALAATADLYLDLHDRPAAQLPRRRGRVLAD